MLLRLPSFFPQLFICAAFGKASKPTARSRLPTPASACALSASTAVCTSAAASAAALSPSTSARTSSSAALPGSDSATIFAAAGLRGCACGHHQEYFWDEQIQQVNRQCRYCMQGCSSLPSAAFAIFHFLAEYPQDVPDSKMPSLECFHMHESQ